MNTTLFNCAKCNQPVTALDSAGFIEIGNQSYCYDCGSAELASEETTWAYSYDGTSYNGPYTTRDEAIAHARDHAASNTAFISPTRPPELDLSCLEGPAILEMIRDNSIDASVEMAEDWPNVEAWALQHLTELMQQTFRDWMATHEAAPKWFICDEPELIHLEGGNDE